MFQKAKSYLKTCCSKRTENRYIVFKNNLKIVHAYIKRKLLSYNNKTFNPPSHVTSKGLQAWENNSQGDLYANR